MIKTNYGKFLSLSRTGMISACPFGTLPPGWIMLDGRTIGNAASGATARANADTQALFEIMWNSVSNFFAVVSGGRGASATADFNANKTIVIPDLRGSTIIAPDNMGGIAAGRLTVAGIGNNGQNIGQKIGANTASLTVSHIPSHTHPYTLNSANPTHSHQTRSVASGEMNSVGAGTNSGNYLVRVNVSTPNVDTWSNETFPIHSHAVVTDTSVSSNLPHDNMMKFNLVYWMVKL